MLMYCLFSPNAAISQQTWCRSSHSYITQYSIHMYRFSNQSKQQPKNNLHVMHAKNLRKNRIVFHYLVIGQTERHTHANRKITVIVRSGSIYVLISRGIRDRVRTDPLTHPLTQGMQLWKQRWADQTFHLPLNGGRIKRYIQ